MTRFLLDRRGIMWPWSATRARSAQFYIDGRPARQHRDFVERCGVTLPNTAEAHDKLQWCLAQVRSQSDFAETRAAIHECASSTLRLPVQETD